MTKKIIDVWIGITDTSIDDVKRVEIDRYSGVLRVYEKDGDIQVFSPSTEWSLIERRNDE